MLRLVVLLLLVANAGYFAWSSGLLRAYGLGPLQQQEPQRLEQQVRPEALRKVSDAEMKRVEDQLKADALPKECLQAGPLDATLAASLRRTLEVSSLPSSAWQLDEVRLPARWIVYVGKLPNADALTKKRAELAGLGVKAEVVRTAALEPGLSLGSAPSRAEAQAELAKLAARGVRTARVVQEREEGRGYLLKLPAVSDAMKVPLADVKAALGGRPLQSCS